MFLLSSVKAKVGSCQGSSSVCNLHRAPNVLLKEGKDILPEESEHSSFAWAVGPGNGNVQSQYISNTRATVQGHENESGVHNSVTLPHYPGTLEYSFF
jgi:hypothetical protein